MFPHRAAEEAPKCLVRVDERRDLDELVAAVRVSGVPGPEVDRVDPVRGEVRDVRPCLLGLHLLAAGFP